MPEAIGPYSHAVRAGNLLYVAGQPGIDPETRIPAGDTIETQGRQAFENLSRVLRAAGSSMAQVVKTTVFLADASAFQSLNELYLEYFPESPPVRSTPIVQLPMGLLISIDCVAVLTDSS